MPIGFIAAREMLVAPRSAGPFAGRAGLIAALGGLPLIACESYRYYYDGPVPAGRLRPMMFGIVVAEVVIAALGTLVIVPQLVVAAISREKEGKTLDFLVGTPLTSFEIVAGKMAGRLSLYLGAFAAGLPVAVLAAVLAPVRLGTLLWALAAIGSTALAIGSLAMLASVLVHSGRLSRRLTFGFTMLWVVLPMIWTVVGRFFFRGTPAWISAIFDAILEGSPAFPMRYTIGLLMGGRLPTLDESTARMIAIQSAFSVACLALACWRLRPSYRNQVGGDVRTLMSRIRNWRWRLRRRPPIGDDPIFWREAHTSRTPGVSKLAGVVLGGLIVGLIAWPTVLIASRAVQEAREAGLGPAQVDRHRDEFATFTRGLTAMASTLVLLVVGGAVGGSIPLEVERETWLGVLATPLTGREILASKRRAALYAARPILAAIVGYWVVGVGLGSIHPVGALVGAGLLASWLGLAAALGSWFSTRIDKSGNASGAPASLILLLSVVPAMTIMHEPMRTSWWSIASPAALLFMGLLSRHNAPHLAASWTADLARVDGPSNSGFFDHESYRTAIPVVLVGAALPIVAASLLRRHAEVSFDRRFGRPSRPRSAPSGDVLDGHAADGRGA